MNLPDISLFNIIYGALMLVGGFLLNRVFIELDKISKSNGELREGLPKEYVTKSEFLRHMDVETRTIERMSSDITKRFDKLDLLLEAVRVKQERHD